MSRLFKGVLIHLILLSITFADNNFSTPKINYNPRKYVCYKTEENLKIDGKLNEKSWKNTKWTREFVDIQGKLKPKPKYTTKVKMLWDNNYIYFGAFLEEPHIWARLKKRDTIIFKDNDFEIFIDPDFDTHNYYELEINAFNTIWDLFLTKPYRDEGKPIFNWDIKGLKSSVYIDGSINNPNDIDEGWYIEIAYPWKALAEGTDKQTPPKEGQQWRLNFSRVEWNLRSKNGKYRKKTDSQTGKIMPADNWVWSPQGLINMHYPEMWGIVQFTNHRINSNTKIKFKNRIPYKAISYLYRMYYKQQKYKNKNGKYASYISKLDDVETTLKNYKTPLKLMTGEKYFQLYLEGNGGNKNITLNSEGYLNIY